MHPDGRQKTHVHVHAREEYSHEEGSHTLTNQTCQIFTTLLGADTEKYQSEFKSENVHMAMLRGLHREKAIVSIEADMEEHMHADNCYSPQVRVGRHRLRWIEHGLRSGRAFRRQGRPTERSSSCATPKAAWW